MNEEEFISKPLETYHECLIHENIENKEVAKNIKLQFEFYDAAISYLQDECLAKFEFEPKKIGKTAATVRPRKKSSEYQGFKTNLNAKQIEEIFRDLIFYKFIPSNSDLKNFICIFQGGYPTEKITWLGCNFELRYFIQKIYPKITKNPPKQIWEVTINCFCNEEGESYDKKQLRFNTEKPNSTNEIILVVDNILNEYSGS